VYLAGHVASAALLARHVSRNDRTASAWLVFGALVPDVLDKGQLWLGTTVYGRTVGHSLLLWGGLALLRLLSGRGPRSLALSMGGALHLAVDLVDDFVEGFERSGWAFSAWMGWPVTNPDMMNWHVPRVFAYAEGHPTSLEIATVATLLAVWIRRCPRGAHAA
jgi:hypothetical protein